MSLSLQVLGFALILLHTFNVAMPLWRIRQGMPQAPELLIHPTVWLTTMVITAYAGAQLAPKFCFLLVWRAWGGKDLGASPSALHPLLSRALPPS